MSASFTVADVTTALGREPAQLPDPAAAFERVVIDSRRTAAGDLFVAIRGDHFDGNDFLGAAVEAGATGAVGEDGPFDGRDGVAFWPVEDGREALQKLAVHHRRRLEVPLVAITGSNGKTTTKELVAAVLSQRFRTTWTQGNLNNQIGVPLTLFEIDPEDEWAVVELGTNRSGEIARLAEITGPEVGIITNVAASHLEGLGTVEKVVEEKMALGRALGSGELLIYCGDQERLREAAAGLACDTLSYGLEPHNDLAPEGWSLDEDGRGTFRLDGRTFRLRIPGRHNLVNALAAVAMGREAGIEDGAIAAGLAEIDGLPLRMQLQRWGDVTALIDCYNANPESVLSAASTLSRLGGTRRRVAVLGKMLELGRRSRELHARTGRELAGTVDLVIAVGEEASPIAEGAAAAGLENRRFPGREAAAEWLIDHLRSGDAVLFKASRGAELERVVAPVREACLERSGLPVPGEGG
ncbi:MAG: UDP-N-acetylmuramoyl-tripeptide--D-alanyl-D-alanine ligase [Gemmatimonadota bacterium]|nr:UDP-N-acetylmuramoyl-tripeptide--D-alanyl-D-alanine ligase [Gemmatimonadota bacterium]